jgi:lipopolysaccharide export system protein LptA
MGGRIAGWGAALALALGAGPAAAEVAIGVAPFERVAEEGHGVPDVASRLAQRLGTKGVDKVVGPEQLGAPAQAEPAAHEVSSWAGRAGVGYVVVGRTTRLGNTLSVDARLLDARSGAALGTRLVEEANRPEDLGRAIDDLATEVLARVAEGGGARAAPAPPIAAAPPPVGAPESEPKPSGKFSSSAPISIKADELEAFDSAQQKKFVFTGHVRAVQEDLLVRSDRLEAFYPKGASQPDRLEATGRVVLEQKGRKARCEKAIYYRSDNRVDCTGSAELEQQCDRVRGEKITFFLDREVLKVTGAADVRMRPEEPGCEPATAQAKP